MQFVSSPSAQRSRSRFSAYAVQLIRALSGTLRLFRLGARDGVDLMARYNALARLSDEALARRGLRRDEIGRAVLEGRLAGFLLGPVLVSLQAWLVAAPLSWIDAQPVEQRHDGVTSRASPCSSVVVGSQPSVPSSKETSAV